MEGKSDDVIHRGSGDDDSLGSDPFSVFFNKGEDVLYGGEGDDDDLMKMAATSKRRRLHCPDVKVPTMPECPGTVVD